MRALIALLLALGLTAPAFAAGGHGGGEPKAKPESSERKLTSAPSWVAVDPVAVAILRQNRIQGMFLVEFGLDIADETLRGQAQETLPRLRDAWLRGMSDFAITRVRVGRQADLDALTTRLQETTDKMLGAPGAKILLLQAVVRQK
jgi:flagellar basal body-associated protein FliL